MKWQFLAMFSNVIDACKNNNENCAMYAHSIKKHHTSGYLLIHITLTELSNIRILCFLHIFCLFSYFLSGYTMLCWVFSFEYQYLKAIEKKKNLYQVESKFVHWFVGVGYIYLSTVTKHDVDITSFEQQNSTEIRLLIMCVESKFCIGSLWHFVHYSIHKCKELNI